jgi:cell division ATPase FtsA
MARPSTNLSINELERIIHARQKELGKLERHRSKFRKQLDRVEARIRALTGNSKASTPRGGARVHNDVSLAESVYHVLSRASAPLGIGEIAEKVQAGGYRSNSESFRTVVNVTLIKDKRFAKAGRGLYQLKAGAAKAQPSAAGKKAGGK